MTATHKTPNPAPYVAMVFGAFAFALLVSIPVRWYFGDSTADTLLIILTAAAMVFSTAAYVANEPAGVSD